MGKRAKSSLTHLRLSKRKATDIKAYPLLSPLDYLFSLSFGSGQSKPKRQL